ncbi:hypothetical protein CVU75_01515 [Candidatus Dependentiae bacterium HGW-Dependentiae-1]|nr:MAG: hypothetical protein CVU75_01515 [Candidatus Dependentiae bacterium HGW-Dependentiae-1]
MLKSSLHIILTTLMISIAPCCANHETHFWWHEEKQDRESLKQKVERLKLEKEAREVAELLTLLTKSCASCLDRLKKPETPAEYQEQVAAAFEYAQKAKTEDAWDNHKKIVDRGWKKTWADRHPYLYCVGLPVVLVGTAVGCAIGYAINHRP